jgi:excisionase family DNA binding protein
VAKRLRVCRATVYRMIDEGRLPAVRVSSGAIRIDAELLHAKRVPAFAFMSDAARPDLDET